MKFLLFLVVNMLLLVLLCFNAQAILIEETFSLTIDIIRTKYGATPGHFHEGDTYDYTMIYETEGSSYRTFDGNNNILQTYEADDSDYYSHYSDVHFSSLDLDYFKPDWFDDNSSIKLKQESVSTRRDGVTLYHKVVQYDNGLSSSFGGIIDSQWGLSGVVSFSHVNDGNPQLFYISSLEKLSSREARVVPEPSTLILSFFALSALIIHRRFMVLRA